MEQQIVNVATFRNLITHLERVIRADWCACVGDKEKSYCLKTAARLGAKLVNTTCKRSTEDDEQRKVKVLARTFELISNQ